MPAISCDLVEALASQEIDAKPFLPFAVLRLQAGDTTTTDAQIAVRTVDRNGVEVQQTVSIHWPTDSISLLPPAVQPSVVTEWGALGVACALLHSLGGGLRLTSVAREGDRFGYWVGDDFQEWGLEISGTDAESLAERHRDKTDQLLSNPYGVDGFVIVVHFAQRKAWFTFHRQSERRVQR